MAAKIMLNLPLLDFDGEPLKADLTPSSIIEAVNQALRGSGLSSDAQQRLEQEIEGSLQKAKVAYTIRDALLAVARAPFPDSTAVESTQLFNTAVSCIGKTELELESEEQATVLKTAFFKMYKSALVSQQLFALLEGRDPFAGASKE